MSEITESEQLLSAQFLVKMLEDRVSQVEAERAAHLAESVDINSRNQAYWYASDVNGYIPILEDAAFVCTGIHVISQEEELVAQFLSSIENLSPSRHATQSAAVPLSFTSATNTGLRQSISIPIDHLLPAYTNGNSIGVNPANVDYWYTPVAEWLIERGDTIRCLFQGNASDVVPLVILAGYKVIG